MEFKKAFILYNQVIVILLAAILLSMYNLFLPIPIVLGGIAYIIYMKYKVDKNG